MMLQCLLIAQVEACTCIGFGAEPDLPCFICWTTDVVSKAEVEGPAQAHAGNRYLWGQLEKLFFVELAG